jgi:XRE family transcriptional regulator, thiamine biosynthesis regulator
MMVDSFLPAMREAVARRLSQEGYSQGKIAAMLGVTQASVSLYLKPRHPETNLLSRLGISRDQAEVYSSLLAEDLKKSPVYAVNTLYSIWSDALGRGVLCASHRGEYPSLADCTMCIVRFGEAPAPGRDAVDHVASAVKLLEASSAFTHVMPEVSVNIAYAPLGASSPKDVVAVPGRIMKVKGMPRSFMRPEFGASTHVASVLLAAMSRDPSKRAAANIRYDERIDSIVRRKDLAIVRVDGGIDMLSGLRLALEGTRGNLDAVVDPGGPGSEPGLYLLAEDAVSVARLGVEIAREYSVPD